MLTVTNKAASLLKVAKTAEGAPRWMVDGRGMMTVTVFTERHS
jgi:hypothetical protein